VSLTIYHYRKDKEKFSDLLTLLKKYKGSPYRKYLDYELIKTARMINIKCVNHVGNIIIPGILSVILSFATLITFILLIIDYNSDILIVFCGLLFLTMGMISVPYNEIADKPELHYFNTVESIYISEEDKEVSFDKIYAFFIEYTLVYDYNDEGPSNNDCYKLNMILKDGTVIHIISELFEKDDLFEDSKIIAQYTQKPLYNFDTDINVYLLSLASKVKVMTPFSQQHKKQNSLQSY